MPAIPYKKTATTDGAWDAGANVKNLPQSKAALRAAHAWVDPDGDPDTKGSYKFPHHEVHGNGVVSAANINACSAIIGALNGGRGGADIPDADRQGVYNHAAGHLNAAGKEPPELKGQHMADIERRVVTSKRGKLEVRTAEDGKRTLDGYGAVFNEETVIGGGMLGFREKVAPGAFTDSIKVDDVRGLFNHDANFVLGRNTNGTMRLAEDGVGLHYEIDVNADDPDAVGVAAKITRGDVSGSSFAFTVPQDGDVWDFTEVKSGKLPLRTIVRATLYDVSPVTYPAYPQTYVSARAKDMAQSEPRGASGASAEYFDATDTLPEKTKAAVVQVHRSAEAFHAAVRSLQEQVDISDAEDYGDLGTGDSSGSATDDGDADGSTSSNAAKVKAQTRAAGADLPKLKPGAAHAVRALRRSADGARHQAMVVRACMRDASDGDGGDMGGDAGDGGANAALMELTLRERELEFERLR